MEHVYSGRTLLSTPMAEIQVPVLNARAQEVTIIQGTLLGKVFTAEMATPSPPRSVRRTQAGESISPAHEEVIQRMVDGLLSELTSEQREKVRKLLIQYRTILSLGDHDVGRTHLVEHTIDTGDHRPIRQPLRRQPFQHQDYIDQETNRMLEYGIIEPAASPWASNVYLSPRKMGHFDSVWTIEDSIPSPIKTVIPCH